MNINAVKSFISSATYDVMKKLNLFFSFPGNRIKGSADENSIDQFQTMNASQWGYDKICGKEGAPACSVPRFIDFELEKVNTSFKILKGF